MLRNKIIKELFENQDQKYKEFSQKLCPTNYQMIGVRIPTVKQITKKYVKEYGIKLFDELDNQYFEEVLIKGLIIGYQKEINYEYIKKFVPLIDNWSICDTTICNMKQIKCNLEKYYLFINKNYRESTNEFEQRFLIVTYLNFYIDKNYIDDTLRYIDSIKTDKYYVQMAIAWFLSTAYIKENTKIKEYLKSSNLDKFTYNKALQKICESYKVSDKEKKEIRKLKRS